MSILRGPRGLTRNPHTVPVSWSRSRDHRLPATLQKLPSDCPEATPARPWGSPGLALEKGLFSLLLPPLLPLGFGLCRTWQVAGAQESVSKGMNECALPVWGLRPGAPGIENTPVSPPAPEHEKQSKQSPAASARAPPRYSWCLPAVGGASGRACGLTGLPRAEVGAYLFLVLSEPPARRLGGPRTLSSLSVVAAADSHGPHVCLHTVPRKDIIIPFDQHFGTFDHAGKRHRNELLSAAGLPSCFCRCSLFCDNHLKGRRSGPAGGSWRGVRSGCGQRPLAFPGAGAPRGEWQGPA